MCIYTNTVAAMNSNKRKVYVHGRGWREEKEWVNGVNYVKISKIIILI